MKHQRSGDGMSLIVKTVCNWLKGFILLYGIYTILYGHLTPGGGFAGGVIAACAFIFIVLAEGQEAGLQTLSRRAASAGDSLGGLAFLGIACLGLVLTGTFFVNFVKTSESQYFRLFSGGIIPLCNLGIGLKVCCALYLVFVVLTAVNRELNSQRKGDNS